MAARNLRRFEPVALAGLRFGIAEGLPLDRSGRHRRRGVRRRGRAARPGRRALHARTAAAARRHGGEINAKGGIAPAEACAIHRDRLAGRGADIDPNVRAHRARLRHVGG
jgi:hypothetical protein